MDSRESVCAPASPSQHGRYTALSEALGNLQLLLGAENMEKSNQAFETWIGTRSSGFKRLHLIPEDASFYSLQRFPTFVKAREKPIAERLKQVFAAQ